MTYRWCRLAFVLAVLAAPATGWAQTAPAQTPVPQPPAPPSAPAQAPVAQAPPFEPQLLRLSELMGALHYLRSLCGFADAPAWRDKMSALIEGQGLDDADKERYAGAFNRGYRTFHETYRSCNDAAAKVIKAYLVESGNIVKDLDSRYAR